MCNLCQRPLSLSPFCRLVNSSVIEAAETIEKMSLREDKNLKLALFSLQKFIKVSGMRENRGYLLTLSRRRKSNLRRSFSSGAD